MDKDKEYKELIDSLVIYLYNGNNEGMKNDKLVIKAAQKIEAKAKELYEPDKFIFFYRAQDPYGIFSNFAMIPLVIDGFVWPTSEHYFQAQKFDDKELQAKIRACKYPSQAAKMGRKRNLPLKEDWEEIKEEVMYKALEVKFYTSQQFRETLLSTGDKILVEHTSNDHYWGDGSDGENLGPGKNRLGHLLMKLREENRK